MSDVKRIPATKCLECGHGLNSIGAIIDERGPQPGDPIACIRCGAAMTIGEDGKLRGFTKTEMDELLADTEAMNDLAQMVKKIHLLKHAQN